MPHLERLCDACDQSSWEYMFSDNGYDLFRCTACGLHSVNPLQPIDERVSEMSSGKVGDKLIPGAITHFRGEQARVSQFRRYIDCIATYAPQGKLLDIGCGTGTLLAEAKARGYETEGIELVSERAAIARKQTGSQVFEEPVEYLNLLPSSFDAIAMINVFSHLVSPRKTLVEIARLLKPGGVLLMHTGEVGPGARKQNARNWELGDHLHWLGPDTINRYAAITGLTVVRHDRAWAPRVTWGKQAFEAPGRSRRRNIIKSIILIVPGAYPLLFRLMLYRSRDIRSDVATILLQKQ